MKNFVRLFLFIVLVVTSIAGFAQHPEVVPPSFEKKGLSMNIPLIKSSSLDKAALLLEDEESMKMGNPLRIAVMQPLNYTMDNSGRLDKLGDGSQIWRLNIQSPGADRVELHLTEVSIPDEARIYVYDPSHTSILGDFSMKDLLENNQLLTEEVPGDEIIIEYYQPAEAEFDGSFVISNIGHNYRGNLFSKGSHGNSEEDCYVDVNCAEGEGWRDQINSAVFLKLTINSGSNAGTYFCSGAMINNVRQDKTPYVLTADHCDMGGSVFRFFFNYQAATCGSSNGSAGNMVLGGVIRARAPRSNSSDFMLVEITGEITDVVKENLYFAGWDITGSTPSVGAGIHHPGGDFKKISIPQTVFSGSTNFARYWGVRWLPGYLNKGVTEGGSSGSPLFGANKKIVGQLWGGSSNCDRPTSGDYYGKLSWSWTNGNIGEVSAQIKPWLDPDNTGITLLDGIYYLETVDVSDLPSSHPSIEVYPNPTTGVFTIKGDFGNTEVQCEIYTLLGTLVQVDRFPNQSEISMDLSNLENGIYFLKLTYDQNVQTVKLIIAK